MKSSTGPVLLATTLLFWPSTNGFTWKPQVHNSHPLQRFLKQPPWHFASVQDSPSQASLADLKDDDINDDSTVLIGVQDFEAWFSSVTGAKCDPSIRHRNFGKLRGLGCDTSKVKSTEGSGVGEWMTIPRSIVLQSDLSKQDWDARLAQNLWQEVLKGRSSAVAGYTALLVRGWTVTDLPCLPPSSARDSLRHWTAEQKALLASSAAGQRVLDLQREQEQLWRSKFSSINGMTWEQFEWAMEVVHSRAFCGDFGFGRGLLPPAATTASPIIAAFAGYAYFVPMHGQNDAILLGLCAIAALPGMINLITQSPPVAVLLPLIDSANHREEADSSIVYSPWTDSFSLTAGKKCLVAEANGKEQLYISYGKKKDSELLLNYGFLQGVATEGDAISRRRKLSETFLANNQIIINDS